MSKERLIVIGGDAVDICGVSTLETRRLPLRDKS
jgi:hypothetical protein